MILPILTDEEIRPLLPAGDEPGFGALATPLGNLPLAAVQVRGKIAGLLAEVTLEQTFRNVHAQPLEATYIFPLPDRAGVTGFRFEVAGRVIDGVLKERGAAREEYDQAIQRGHRAAIAEEERPGTFTMRVGNILPRESATVRLTMTLPLPYVDGEATFRFPLVVAPRYIPGTPLGGENVGDGTAPDTDAVPDASRISPPVLLPGFPNPVRLGIEIEVDESAMRASRIRCALHAAVEGQEGGKRVIRLHPGDRLDRDFILRLAYATDSVRTGLALSPDEGGGTFALTLVPPADLSRASRPRDVIFVLDHSGSMEGWKMVAARRAVARMVDSLNDADSFNVYAFDDSIATPPAFVGSELVRATNRNRFRAVEFLAKVEAEGGTEMAQPLARAVGVLAAQPAGRDRVLVLATDGQVGNEDQILRTVGQKLAGIRVFTVGIDRAVNEGFLQRMAAAGGGAYELVETEERLDEAMDRLHRRVGTPVLTGLQLQGAGLQLDRASISPARLPDLFAGAPVVISGRYAGSALGAIRLTATDAAGMTFTQELQSPPAPNRAITTVWARGRVRDLEDRYVIDGQPEHLANEILQTSLRFGVMCRFTAFVAVDRSEVVNKGGPLIKQTQAVDAPQGWAMLDVAAMPMMVAEAPPEHDYEGSVSELSAELADDAKLRAPPLDRVLRQSTLTGGLPRGGSAGAPPRPAPAAPSSPPRVGAPSASRAPGAPPPAPKAAMKRKIASLFGAVKEEAAPPAPPAKVALEGYRGRAEELLELLRAGTPDERARAVRLGTLVVKLGMLVDDLRSIGCDPLTLAPLATLLDELRKLVGKSPLPPFEAETERTLRAFAEGEPESPHQTPGRKRSFWK